eukprot:2698811-Pleurochrysis_carterae.AAC.1
MELALDTCALRSQTSTRNMQMQSTRGADCGDVMVSCYRHIATIAHRLFRPATANSGQLQRKTSRLYSHGPN